MADTKEIREALADLEHTRWSNWQSYLHSKCEKKIEIADGRSLELGGELLIPADSVAHWQRQIDTPYAGLTEREKDSDRKEADQTIALLRKLGVDL